MHYPPGGYDYPKQVAARDTDFYFYPIRNLVSRRDSMRDAMVYESFRAFDEPNLSLRPMSTDIFRLTYGEALNRDIIIIILNPKEIVVKSGKATHEYAQLPDTSRLDTLERRLVTLLDRYYPLDEKKTNRSAWRQHYIDSMGKRYPRLYDPIYYRSLWDKEYAYSKPLFTYTSRKIRITPSDFDHLVSGFNSAGYWHLPVELPCQSPPMDGWGFTLEANTSSKYNIVSAGSCDDTDTTHFSQACQELIRYAKMDSVIHLAWDPKSDTAHFKPLVIQEAPPLKEVQDEPVKKKHKKK